MNMDLHATGASFIAMNSENNPRDIVVELVKKHPEADRKQLFVTFREMLEESGEEYRKAVEWYFFVNMYDYLVTSRTKHDPLDKSEARLRERVRIEAAKTQIIMLDLTMPNGKAMRDCTGADMAKFGNRYQRIAEKVGKAKTVGTVLSEDQVKAILK